MVARTPASPGRSSPLLLCLALHITLILIFVALLVVASYHFEHGYNFPLTSSGEVRLSLAISVVSQTFGTIYLAGLVVVTQRIALANNFHKRQTLTAIHDKVAAWLGLGSALSVLYTQIALPAAFSGVIVVTLYLGGITVLHIAIPASLAVNIFNATDVVTPPTQLARFSNLSFDAVSYDILAVYDRFTTIGLQDNIIYDVIPVVPLAFGETVVNATVFTADCGDLPEATETDFVRYSQTDNHWLFDIGHGVGHVSFDASMWRSIATASTDGSMMVNISNSNAIVVASTLPIVDSASASKPAIQIHPAIQVTEVDSPISSLQMFACNIEAANISIKVSSVTRTPVGPSLPLGNVTWHDWAPVGIPTDPILVRLATLSDNSPSSSHWHWQGDQPGMLINRVPSDNVSSSDNLAFTIPSMLDVFLMEDLGLFTLTDPNPTLQLEDFQISIGKAVAAIAWYERNRNYSSPYASADAAADSPIEGQDLTGEAVIQAYVLRMRLHFNVAPLIAGLVTSCLLLLLACTQMWNREGEPIRYDIDKAGVLQLTWLVGDEPHLRGVVEPTDTELREAGLFEIHMGSLLRQRACRPGESDAELVKFVSGEVA